MNTIENIQSFYGIITRFFCNSSVSKNFKFIDQVYTDVGLCHLLSKALDDIGGRSLNFKNLREFLGNFTNRIFLMNLVWFYQYDQNFSISMLTTSSEASSLLRIVWSYQWNRIFPISSSEAFYASTIPFNTSKYSIHQSQNRTKRPISQ